MGKILQPGAVTVERHIITRDGQMEVTIHLNLNISLDANGGLRMSVDGEQAQAKPVKKLDKDTNLLVPEFGEISSNDIIDFGSNVD